MKNKRRKRIIRVIAKYILIALAILFDTWIIVSFFNVNANNLSGGNVWDWNFFKILIDLFG